MGTWLGTLTIFMSVSLCKNILRQAKNFSKKEYGKPGASLNNMFSKF